MRFYRFRSSHLIFFALIMFLGYLVATILLNNFGMPYFKSSSGRNIWITTVKADSPLYLNPGWGRTSNGELTINIKNISSETLDFDFWADAVDGISFLDQNGKPASQAVISGLPMGAGETRLIRFQYTLAPTTIAGDYNINIHASVPVREDQINLIYKITVQR